MQQQYSKNKKISFPKKSSLILQDLLDKYKIIEDTKTYIEKIKEEELSNSRKAVILIRSVALGITPEQKLTQELKKQFGLSMANAQKLSKEIKEKILTTIIFKTSSKNGSSEMDETKSIKSTPDGYREPVA